MATTAPVATQHELPKLAMIVGGMFSSLYKSIVFARLCEAEWADQGHIDAAALKRICKLSELD